MLRSESYIAAFTAKFAFFWGCPGRPLAVVVLNKRSQAVMQFSKSQNLCTMLDVSVWYAIIIAVRLIQAFPETEPHQVIMNTHTHTHTHTHTNVERGGGVVGHRRDRERGEGGEGKYLSAKGLSFSKTLSSISLSCSFMASSCSCALSRSSVIDFSSGTNSMSVSSFKVSRNFFSSRTCGLQSKHVTF